MKSLSPVRAAKISAAVSASAVRLDPIYIETIEAVPMPISELVQDNDLVMTQGAGSVNKLSRF